MRKPLVLIKGGGDLASGTAHGLTARGVGVVITELARPTMVRRMVSFGNAVYEGEVEIEGIKGVLCPAAKEAFIAVHAGNVAVLVDPTCSALGFLTPDVLVDARLAKRNLGTKISDAPVVIAIGPGFVAGRDCHAVVESLRGPGLGKVLLNAAAAPNTGRPAAVSGHATERVLRAPSDGRFEASLSIGDVVKAGVKIGHVLRGSEEASAGGAGLPADVVAAIPGVLKGLIAEGTIVSSGQKIGDIDPSGVREKCFSMSDKALTVGDGVIEAIRQLARDVLGNAWPPSRRGVRLQGRGIEYLRRRWPASLGDNTF